MLPELKSPTKDKKDVLKEVPDRFPETRKEIILLIQRAYHVPGKCDQNYSLLNIGRLLNFQDKTKTRKSPNPPISLDIKKAKANRQRGLEGGVANQAFSIAIINSQRS